ncbi:4-alpha-glucanotransferase [Streptomyces tropicalis]|uniref:4-alpha-glucanotransferase n=1 Tax=Streptomyces tropicalis TaxID=3034234 RepID=A0ABT5ZZA0_9ACTN|nr:4-alpha-glucanotransferase [Streptomyces tropicalis]MDF3297558.1 4-alpha-glucanotransferase [Streptomyces tropicalis]
MTAPRPALPSPEDLTRLAELHGVATSYSPSPGRTVAVSAAAVVAALAALDVDASTPEAARAALTAGERALTGRLLPPTVVLWTAAPARSALPGAATAPPAPVTAAPGAPTAAPPARTVAAGSSTATVTAGSGRADGGPRETGTPPAVAALPAGTRLAVETEQGYVLSSADGLPPGLPPGVHRLTATAPDGRTGQAHLVVAPPRLPTPPGRSYGLLVQLYSLLSQRSWGMGDLGDLGELTAWAGRTLGAGFVQVNPLHAAVLGTPTDPSPYRPSSRRFPDPVHLRVEDVPEYPHVEDRERLHALRERAARLRTGVLGEGALIDRDAVWALKREALDLVARVPLGPGRSAAYAAFLAEEGRALEDHATWCALAEVHGSDWHAWPAALRDPRSPQTARARADLRDRVELHRRLAWLTDTQLTAVQRTAREAGMPVGVVHDLAVGVHPGGADAWAQQDHFAAGMSVGAPPDAFNARGQDWGLPPWRPDRLAASGYAPFRRLLRALFRYAGALRIDHVMGLFRLWWVPQGEPPTRGTYVRYDAEAMLAVLVLEASRAGAVVIGEDLGTVEPGVRETLDRRGVLGTSVLWFERDWEGDGRPLPPERWRADCLATATTHDLPSTAARLTGDHVALRDRLGLLTRPLADEQAEAAADVREWLGLLRELGLLGDAGAAPGPAAGASALNAGPSALHAGASALHAGGGPARAPSAEEAEIQALHRFLLRTPARMVGLWLPDTVGDRRPQNLPGTWDQYPNWRLPVADAEGRPVTLEQLAASPRLHALTEVLRTGLRAAPAVPAAATPVEVPAAPDAVPAAPDAVPSGPGSFPAGPGGAP